MRLALRHIIVMACMVLLTPCMNARNDISVKASIDSTALVQGSKAMIKVEVLRNSGDWTTVNAPEIGSEYSGVEFAALKVDTTALGNDRLEIDYNYTIQAFDPGTITIPPFRFVSGNDTVESDVLTLKVLEVDLDTLTDINPMESVVTVPSKWYDIFPDWWIWVLLGIAVAGIAACAVLLFCRKTGLVQKPVKVTPPYELALMRLNSLQDKKLPQSGRDKEYYTELTDILRQYLDGRFGINAMEMTSTQIINTLRRNKDTKPGSDLMKQILEIADFVKFAKVRPLPDDNIKSFNSAMKFVEDSKPLPPATDENGNPISPTDKPNEQ